LQTLYRLRNRESKDFTGIYRS